MIKARWLLISLLLLFFTGVAGAQQNMPTGKWWHMPKVVDRLDLSEDDVARLDDAYKDNRRKLIRLKAGVEEQQFELQDLFEDRRLDEQAALEQYHNLEKARTRLGVQRFKYFIRIRKIVGYERFKVLMEYRKKRSRMTGKYGRNLPRDE